MLLFRFCWYETLVIDECCSLHFVDVNVKILINDVTFNLCTHMNVKLLIHNVYFYILFSGILSLVAECYVIKILLI